MNFGKYLIVVCGIAFVFMGCQPKEYITLIAPTGTTVGCSIDGENVGDATDQGLKVKVEPGSHTAAWNINGTPISAPVNLPVTDNLLEVLLTIKQGSSVAVYGTHNGLGTASDVSASGLGQTPRMVSYGQEFKTENTKQLSCANIIAKVDCIAGWPETFLAEVTVEIFSECQEEGEGEFYEDKSCEQEVFENMKPDTSGIIINNSVLQSIAGIGRILSIFIH